MTNTQLIRNDRRLVSNMSPITFGTIIKAWRSHKGLDYILVGINTTKKEIYAVKHNCINENGSVHASVRRHKRVFKYTLTPSGHFGIIKGFTTVLGQKESMDFDAINRFNNTIDRDVKIEDFNNLSLHAQPLVDRRKNSVYK